MDVGEDASDGTLPWRKFVGHAAFLEQSAAMLGQNEHLSNGTIFADLATQLAAPLQESYRGQTPAVKLRIVVKCRFS